MSSVPISYNTAMSVHRDLCNNQNEGDQTKKWKFESKLNPINSDLTPLTLLQQNSAAKYNSKMMNSIWGLYNRYAASSFQKNSEANRMAAAYNKSLMAYLGGHF